MGDRQLARKFQEENFGDFDFESNDKRDPKNFTLDEHIKAAIKEKKVDVVIEYAFQEGNIKEAHELYYKYFSNLRTQNKDKLKRVGLLAEDIGLHYEAFKKFVKTNDYFRTISSAKKANINIPVKYIKLAIDHYIERLGNAPGLKDIAEIIGSDSNNEVKGLFLEAIDYLEKKEEYSTAVDIAFHIGEYNIVLKNYLKESHFLGAARVAKKMGLENESKEYYKHVLENFLKLGKIYFTDPHLKLGRMKTLIGVIKEAKEAGVYNLDLKALEEEARQYLKSHKSI